MGKIQKVIPPMLNIFINVNGLKEVCFAIYWEEEKERR